jgi:hypothetical protein
VLAKVDDAGKNAEEVFPMHMACEENGMKPFSSSLF